MTIKLQAPALKAHYKKAVHTFPNPGIEMHEMCWLNLYSTNYQVLSVKRTLESSFCLTNTAGR